MQFTHGANPFWRLDDYPGGAVFPDATESVGNIGYEETVAGLQHLEDVETDGARTAYVTTDSLTRSSEALSFGSVEVEETRDVVTLNRGRETVTTEIVPGTNSASFTVDPEVDTLKAELRDPGGSTVVTAHQLRDQGERIEWFVGEPAPGEWTIELQNLKGTDRNTVVVAVDTILSEGTGVEAPDPCKILGYEQRSYTSTPFTFFDNLAEIVRRATGDTGHSRGRGGNRSIDPVDIAAVADGALFPGNSDKRASDNLVIIHADGLDDEAYLDAIDRFVDAGGDVVLTDTGIDLLGAMDNDHVSGFPAGAIREVEMYVAALPEKNSGHPLLEGTREIQVELWKPTPLGYPGDFSGAAPVTGIDPDAFEAAGGTIAGYGPDDPDGGALVAAGSIGGDGNGGAVHVIGGMLPPANQSHLHPFGMVDYTASFFAQMLLTNALGYRQRRYVDGEAVVTIGD